MVGLTLGMLGAIYGIVLAFVIVTLWAQMEETQAIVASEAAAAALITRDAAACPAPVRARLDAAIHPQEEAAGELNTAPAPFKEGTPTQCWTQ
ncbi:hypothetical protein QA943_40035 [Streptomyces sp. B21-097]|uniref:bestrophin-like domain n=1 Tax=Streptomyces sp. B21-097 TaxID=3039414 RepID=UPI002FF32379